ncbi:Protein ENHANCED DISEASE RESISTANCE 4 [Hirschfeldia incana]|nr:Protein ENHANCED DISEASE RESISTANCE 4 [Hirschfeldia incana]
MASKSGQRVRLVKCPKCLKILQEDEDVPVYQCGGCSAILQAKRRSTAPKTTPSAGEAEGVQASEPPNTGPSSGEAERAQASEPSSTAPSSGEVARAQASELPDTPPSAGEAERTQASEPPKTAPSVGETEGAQASEPPNTEPSAGETEGAQASEPPSERETNNVSSSSGQDMVLPSPTVCSSGQEDEKDQDGSMESTENQLGGLELSKGEESNEIQLHERSLGDSDKNEGEDNSTRLKTDMKSVEEATRSRTSLGSLNADHVVDARASSSSSDAYNKLQAEISPDASPVEDEQDVFQPHRESTDDLPNKTSSAYDGSKSSSDEREDQDDEIQQWNALQNIDSDRFEMQRYPQNFKEQGGSSSSTFSDKRPSGTTTHNQRHQFKSLQLEGQGGRLGRQGRKHVSEQLRPDVPLYPREPYTRISPSYPPSHDVFDRYSRVHSLQTPPYAGGMNYEGVDMYHNNARVRERGQGSRFSGEMTNDTRNQHPGWYSSQMYSSYSSYTASPQRLMEQPPEYYHPRWSHEIVSDAEDHHQRNRHADHLQARRRQPVAKRHIRPTAGGAPFVSCYSCSQNLQLPADFLIFKRKYHLLRCGRCTTVLRFSLQSRTHLVPAVTHDINANRTSSSTPEMPSSSAVQEEDEEEVPVGRGSPLHRLMGYSTVSQVFKASQRPPSV